MLLRRGVIHDDRCVECNVEAESEGHLLWSCRRAQDVWQNSKLHFNFELSRIRSFQDLMWLLLMSDNPDEDSAKVVVMIAWAIWHNRNEVGHGGRKKTGSELVHLAQQYLQGFNEANVILPKLDRTQVEAWAHPSASRYEVNVDGAVFASQKFARVGVVIRDSFGQVVAAISKKINVPLGSLEAEVKAWEEGVKFAREVGVYDFSLEGDCLVDFNA